MSAHYRASRGLQPRNSVANTLTEREAGVILLLAAGLSFKEISTELGISYAAVDSRLRDARRKFAAKTTVHLVVKALGAAKALAVERGPGSRGFYDSTNHTCGISSQRKDYGHEHGGLPRSGSDMTEATIDFYDSAHNRLAHPKRESHGVAFVKSVSDCVSN